MDELHLVQNKEQLLKLARSCSDAPWPHKFALSDDMALKQALMIWEAVSDIDNTWSWVNPELLVHKEEAFCFVEGRVLELLGIRCAVLKQLDDIDAMVTKLDEDLRKEPSEHPPAGYEAWRLRGPQLFFRPDQFGNIDWEDNSSGIQQLAKQMGIVDGVPPGEWYWKRDKAWERQNMAARALKEFNKAFLEVKAEALQVFVNKLTEGADSLLVTYLRGRSHLGAAHMDYTQEFLDVEMTFSGEVTQDTAMDDSMLFLDGDGDDHPPLEGEALKIFNTMNNSPSAAGRRRRRRRNRGSPAFVWMDCI